MGKRIVTSAHRMAVTKVGAATESAAATQKIWTAASPIRRRQISPKAGRGLELLGHAIEYLHDELALEQLCGQTGCGSASKSVYDAIELLKKNSRQIYFSCPVAPTAVERLRSLWRIRIPSGPRPV